MSFKEGISFSGKITDIKPSNQLGVEGRFPVAIVQVERDGQTSEGWYPLEECHGLETGDKVLITPRARDHPSGGSLTIYQLALVK